MPGLVGQYAVAPFTTPVDGDDLLAAVVVSHDNSNASAHTSHDADSTIHFQSSTLAARPAAGTVGRKWLTTDGLRVYYDTGAAWSELAYFPTAGGTVTGASTFQSVVTTTSTQAVQWNGQTTGHQYADAQNTGAFLRWGIERSIGGALFGGSSAYESVIGTQNATSFGIGTNGQIRFEIDSAGVATFNSTVAATAFKGTGTVAAGGVVRLANSTGINMRNAANTADLVLIYSVADNVHIGSGASGITFDVATTGTQANIGVGHFKAGTTTAVTAVGATTIYTSAVSGGYAIVFGSSGGNIFLDTITWDTGTGQIFAITSTVISGIPSGRTYTLSGSNVQLQMSATANSVKVVPIEIN